MGVRNEKSSEAAREIMRRDSKGRSRKGTAERKWRGGFPGANLSKGLKRWNGDWVAESSRRIKLKRYRDKI